MWTLAQRIAGSGFEIEFRHEIRRNYFSKTRPQNAENGICELCTRFQISKFFGGACPQTLQKGARFITISQQSEFCPPHFLGRIDALG